MGGARLRIGPLVAGGVAAVVVTAVSTDSVPASARSATAPCRPVVQLVPTPRQPEAFLQRIAVSPSGEIWAVGGGDPVKNDVGIILRWTGSRFVGVPVPRGTRELRDVAAPAPGQAWAVGIDRVLHWDGHRWSRSPAPAGSLWAVSAAAADDVWAVGTSRAGLLVIHWDGTAWKRVPFLPIPASGQQPIGGKGVLVTWAFLEGVLALGEDDVWVVGTASDDSAIVAHWDGSAWLSFDAPVPSGEGLGSVAATSTGHLWVAGGLRGGGSAAEWDGTTWRVRGRRYYWIPDVAVRGSEVWAILTDVVASYAARWIGYEWIRLEQPHRDVGLMGLAIDRRGDAWAAGWRLGEAPRQRSVIYRYRCST